MGLHVRLAALALLAGCGASTRTTTTALDAGPTLGIDAVGISDAECLDGCAAEAGCIGDSCPATACVPTSPTASPTTYDYVINTLTVDDNTDFGHAHYGFNLDGAWSPAHPAAGPPDCNHQDYFSALDPDQNELGSTCMAGMANGGSGCHGGVDNQLPALTQLISATGTDLGMAWQNEINAGTLVLLIRVADVDGIPGPGFNDCNVTVSVFFGHPLASDCGTLFSGASSFAVDNSSLNTPGDLTTARYQFAGQILNGRLRINPASGPDDGFPFPWPIIDGVAVAPNLHRFQLRASITPASGGAGNLGGYLLQAEASADISEATQCYSCPLEPTPGNILADLATGSPLNCGTTPLDGGADNPNGGISWGMGFTMVRAVIASTTVSGALAGTCGAGDGGTP